MTELSSWSPLQHKFDTHRSDPLSLYQNKFNKWNKFKSGFEKNSFSDKLHRSKSKSRKHNNQREEHSCRPRYEYTSNSVENYDTLDNKTSPRRQRTRRIKAKIEDIPEVAEGDVLNNRYCVISKLGEGGFSLVVKCYDRETDSNVAIKLQRIKYREDAKYEIETLELIGKEKLEYPNDPCNAINLLDTFDFKNSICMVFPLYSCSLLDLLNERLKKSKDIKSVSGRKNTLFTIQEIKHFARQLLQTVSFLYEMDLTHADIKPENILIAENGDICLSDFGLAVFSDDYHSPITGTRQYSPPEIILEYGWDHSLDIWSVACLIAELYLGRPLFETHDNLEHLALMQEVLGPIPSKVVEYADPEIVRKYFYSDNTLRWPEDAPDVSSMQFVAQTLPLREQIQDEDLASLLSSMLNYDPEKRISAKVALAHKFFN